MSRNIFVVGSINMDLVISCDRLPMLGESKKGHSFFQNQGGKGANQAIACKKLGHDNVHFIGAIGNDENGKALIQTMKTYGINIDGTQRIDGVNSGVCMIALDESKKDNILIIDGGTNKYLDKDLVNDYLLKHAKEGDILITQLEVNLDAVYEANKLAKSLGMYTILNPAPICEFNKDIYKYLDLVVLNETEAKLLTNIECETIQDAKSIYEKLNVNEIIITLGGKGGYYVSKNEVIPTPVYKVDVVDTTCAGDTYIGAIALRISKGISIKDSLSFAARCSSITVSRKGAGISIPTKEEIEQFERS